MRRAILLSATAIILAVAVATAQVGQRPASAQNPTPTPTEQPKATALILGQVVDGTSGQPIADAIVTMTPPGGRRGGAGGANANLGAAFGGGAQGQQIAATAAAFANAIGGGRGNANGPQRVMTGSDGRFVFYGLVPGQYSLQVSLTGYSSSLSAGVGGGGGMAAIVAAMAGGGGGGTALQLKEGELSTSTKLRLWKNAVITGTVVDDAGEPAIGVAVQVARRVMAAGRARFVPGATTSTDDRGAYRLNGLVPGNYVVYIQQTSTSIPTAVMSSMIDSVTGNGPGGAGYTLLDAMSSGVSPLAAMTGGVRIGDYMVASSGLLPILSPDGRLLVFQTTFYPNATAPVNASVVALASGEERADINFQLRLIPTSRVSGMATGPDGPVANLGVRLVVPGDGSVSESEIDVATAMSRADGTFVFYGVPPGDFVLRASKQPRPEMPAEMLSNPLFGSMFGGAANTGKPQTETLFASANVSVAGNVDNVALQLAPGFHVSGKLEFESRSNRPPPTAQQLQSFSILLTAVDGRSSGGGLLDGLTPDRANQQGEFKTKGFQAGRYFLTVTGPWQVKSAMIGGRDVLDAPFDLNNDIAGVVVTLVDQMTLVSGTVTSAGETDLSGTTVLMFPFAYRSWITNGMSSRLIKSARPGQNGAFAVPNVPAGEYFIVAIDQTAVGDMQDPAVIDALSRIATHITVATDPVKIELTKARVGK